jgi:hypothetical protein
MQVPMQQDEVEFDGIAVRYGLDGLRNDWRRCSLSSDFLANASCEPRFAQRVVSGAVNELLELVFKLGTEGSAAALNVSAQGERAVIGLELPLPLAAREQMLARIAEIRRAGPQQVYLEQLGAESEPEPLFGLLQLMVDFGAALSVEASASGLYLRLELSTTGENS